MSHVLRRTLTGDQPVIVKGEGSYLIDSTGKRYLDACGGAAVSSLGHDNRAVRDAIARQMETLSFAHTGLFTNEPAEALADFLIEHAPEGTTSRGEATCEAQGGGRCGLACRSKSKRKSRRITRIPTHRPPWASRCIVAIAADAANRSLRCLIRDANPGQRNVRWHSQLRAFTRTTT